jgi:hypothetical protein
MSGWLRAAAAPLRGGSRTVSCCPSSRVPGADGRRHGSPRSEDADPPMVLITGVVSVISTSAVAISGSPLYSTVNGCEVSLSLVE